MADVGFFEVLVPGVVYTMKKGLFGRCAKPVPGGKGNCVGRDPIVQSCRETHGVNCKDGS